MAHPTWLLVDALDRPGQGQLGIVAELGHDLGGGDERELLLKELQDERLREIPVELDVSHAAAVLRFRVARAP